MGNPGVLVSLTFNYGRFRPKPDRIYGILTWRPFCQPWAKKGPGGLCIPPILAGASPEMGATFLMRRILKPCNWRLLIWRESCTTNGESKLPQIRTSLPRMRRMVVIDADQELLLVSFSHMLRTTTISAETEIHLPKAWEMTRWVKYSTKSPDHLSRTELREGDFLGDSTSLCSPCTMVKQTLWSM